MFRRLIIITGLFFALPALALEDTEVVILQTPEAADAMDEVRLILARSIVNTLVVDKTPEEILAMLNEIALTLSNEGLCGLEAIQALLDIDIPFDLAINAIVQNCQLSGTELAALSRSLVPGFPSSGGPGPLVSP